MRGCLSLHVTANNEKEGKKKYRGQLKCTKRSKLKRIQKEMERERTLIPEPFGTGQAEKDGIKKEREEKERQTTHTRGGMYADSKRILQRPHTAYTIFKSAYKYIHVDIYLYIYIYTGV